MAQVKGLRNELAWFVKIMQNKLSQNNYKGGWKNCSNDYLRRRLYEEFHELKRTLDLLPELRNPDRIAKEAADIANFAMMIADNNKDKL